jgi:hypothetical protein
MAMILTLNYIGRPIIDALDHAAGETREDINRTIDSVEEES